VTTASLSPEKFRAEVEGRLIDTFELMLLLGLRSKQAVWKRVETGKLPRPVLVKSNIVALWDRNEVAALLPDRKEG
jgi:predicted DNA-binding transcriptional regulator AlpA